MKQSEMSFLEWMHRFSTQQACLAEIERHRWPEGFLCPRYSHDKAYRLSQRTYKHQCAQCRYQISETAGKTPVLLAVENHGPHAGYLAAQVLPEGVNQNAVRAFAHRRFAGSAPTRSDALPALASLGDHHRHQARVTPPAQAGEWLPKVHLVIANLKRFLLGTFHGVSPRYLQDHVDEFVYRFNRRYWESELPQRLLEAAVAHVPI